MDITKKVILMSKIKKYNEHRLEQIEALKYFASDDRLNLSFFR